MPVGAKPARTSHPRPSEASALTPNPEALLLPLSDGTWIREPLKVVGTSRLYRTKKPFPSFWNKQTDPHHDTFVFSTTGGTGGWTADRTCGTSSTPGGTCVCVWVCDTDDETTHIGAACCVDNWATGCRGIKTLRTGHLGLQSSSTGHPPVDSQVGTVSLHLPTLPDNN